MGKDQSSIRMLVGTGNSTFSNVLNHCVYSSNENAKTIEGDLFKAMVQAGAVSKDNADDIKKVTRPLSRYLGEQVGVTFKNVVY